VAANGEVRGLRRQVSVRVRLAAKFCQTEQHLDYGSRISKVIVDYPSMGMPINQLSCQVDFLCYYITNRN